MTQHFGLPGWVAALLLAGCGGADPGVPPDGAPLSLVSSDMAATAIPTDTLAETQGAPADSPQGLRQRINTLRQTAGLNPLASHTALQQAADNHARWSVTLDHTGHVEDLDDPGWSGSTPPERARSSGYAGFDAVGEVMGYGGNASAALDGLMSGIYHRMALLRHDADELGAAFVSDTQGSLRGTLTVLTGNSRISALCAGPDNVTTPAWHLLCDPARRVSPADYRAARDAWSLGNPDLVVWPPDQAVGVTPVAYGETPDPLPDLAVSGLPLSAAFNLRRVGMVTVEHFALTDVTRGVTVTPLRRLDQASDPQGRLQAGEYALFPLQRLDYGTRYRAELAYTLDGVPGQRQWEFTTIDPGSVHRISARGEVVTVAAGEVIHIYVPPTPEWPLLGAWQMQYAGRGTVSAAWHDANTLRIAFDGAPGERVEFLLQDGSGGSFQLRIRP
ncbi:MAG: CAP domain-containing protein [Magnetococcus sp. WYHC-3]